MEHLIYKSHTIVDNHSMRELLIDINDLKTGYLKVMEERNIMSRKLSDTNIENDRLYVEKEKLQKEIEEYKTFNKNLKNKLSSKLSIKERIFGKLFM